MLRSSLKVECQHIFSFPRLALPHKKHAVTVLSAVKHHRRCIGAGEGAMEPMRNIQEGLSSGVVIALTMDTRSSAQSSPTRVPGLPRPSEIGWRLRAFAEVFPAVMLTLDYCSYYLHCCCSASLRRQPRMCSLSKMKVRKGWNSPRRWILWKRWAKCWATTGSRWLHRRASAMASVMLAWSSCSTGSWRSSSSYPVRLSLRWGTPSHRPLSARRCSPYRASLEPSSLEPRLLSNRRFRCASDEHKSRNFFNQSWPIDAARSYLRRLVQRVELQHVPASTFD